MQKGFALIEIILVLMIISLLVTVAVPNAARFVDKAALDYEQKRLYSELQFTRTLSRTSTVQETGINMGNTFLIGKKNIESGMTFGIDTDTNSYQIFRSTKPVLRGRHYLSGGVTFSTETNVTKRITFDPSGYSNVKSKTIVLTSRRGQKAQIVFDSVGRIRGGN